MLKLYLDEMKNLSEEIYDNIVSFLDYNNQIVFARTNNLLAKIILQRVRIISKLKKVQRLELKTFWRKSPDDYESQLSAEQINKINKLSLSLKELSLSCYNFTEFRI